MNSSIHLEKLLFSLFIHPLNRDLMFRLEIYLIAIWFVPICFVPKFLFCSQMNCAWSFKALLWRENRTRRGRKKEGRKIKTNGPIGIDFDMINSSNILDFCYLKSKNKKHSIDKRMSNRIISPFETKCMNFSPIPTILSDQYGRDYDNNNQLHQNIINQRAKKIVLFSSVMGLLDNRY